MARTTATEVKEILGDLATGIADSVITAIISDANLLITDKLGSSSLSADQLESIEKWMAAHMAASSVCHEASKEVIGPAEVTYTGKWGTRLELTSFGQMVLVLDTTGTMANLGRRPARFWAVPTSYDYETET